MDAAQRGPRPGADDPADAATPTLRERLEGMFPGSSRRTIKQWLEGGRIRVNGRVVRRGDVRIAPHDRVELGPPPPPPFPAALRLVHEDAEILVVDKPPGLLTIATEQERERTAYRLLSEYVAGQPGAGTHRQHVFIVHRLDRETSGLIVFAKTPPAKLRLQDQFEARTVERVYVAVVEGLVKDASGTLRDTLREDRSLRVRTGEDRASRPDRRPADHRRRGGRRGAAREAITRYRVIEHGGQTTFLELRLETGRRGQIRAQLAALGHPIVGDVRYGSRMNPIRRVCLHATRLGFTHPRGQKVLFESPVPAAFRRAVLRA
jgi:23S rRNA pseudouridine1911/1915/1917 synthase